jgi:hypothetical protein
MEAHPKTKSLHLDPSDLYRAADRCPVADSIGVYFESTVPHEDFGGIFCWFESFVDMKSFVASAMLRPNHDDAIRGMYECLLERVSSDLLRALSLMESADDLTPAAVAHLNGILPHRRIKWAGTFHELTHGFGGFEREVRFAFLCQSDDTVAEDCDPFGATPASVETLSPEQMGAFVDFIREYGAA